MFRVVGVITSDRKNFSNTDPSCIAPTQVCLCVCVWGGGGKNWASSFRVILGFLVVSLQFEPADARVLVEHPVPRCPSCTPVLFCVYINSPPPPPPLLALSQCNFAPLICFMLASIPTFG